jgi:hypothetical protein
LAALGAPGSTSEITVTVTDTEGNQATQVFTVTVADDYNNGAPFLNDIPLVQGTTNHPVTFDLSSQDEEGDPVRYDVFVPSVDVPYEVSLDPATGSKVVIVPKAGFVGETAVIVIVQRNPPSLNPNDFDFQVVPVKFDIPFAMSINRSRLFEAPGDESIATVTVTRPSFLVGSPLEIALSSGSASKLNLPPTVVIPAGQTSATFQISSINNSVAEGSQPISISGYALDYTASAAIDIIDDDSVSPWQNAVLPYDVDKDGFVDPLDVLLVINQLTRRGTGLLPIPTTAIVYFMDTDGDHFLSPIDVLRVINAINRRGPSGEGEGIDLNSSDQQSSALSIWMTEELSKLRNRRSR